jgi:outer membrane biosynthesis protein TonB
VGLTDDQKAMLRLLAQREEGYDDMAALMGISVEEVRERVKEALAEVEEPPAPEQEPEAAAPPPPVEPPQPVAAKPPAAAPPAPVEEPEPVEPPEVEKPAPVSASKPKPAASKRRPARVPSIKVPKDRGALIGLGAGALVVVALVIVLIVGGDGGGSSTGTTSGEASLAENASAAAENKNLTQAVLSADDGSDASGQAIFGRFKKKVLLQVTGEGLEPSSSGESYAVWLSHSGQAMVPVGTVKVKDDGKLAARFEVPPTVLVLVARAAFDEIQVTRTSDNALNAAIAKARKTKKESAYTGTPVLSGKIAGPLVGAGSKSGG